MVEMEDLEEERLRKVFDACDEEGRGFISVEHLRTLANQYLATTTNFSYANGHTESDSTQNSIQKILSVLDRDGSGSISFEEFCDGVRQILNLQQQQSQHITENEEDVSESVDDILSSETRVIEGALDEDLKYYKSHRGNSAEATAEQQSSTIHTVEGLVSQGVHLSLGSQREVTSDIPLPDDDVDSGCHCSINNHTSHNHISKWQGQTNDKSRVISSDLYENGAEETYEYPGVSAACGSDVEDRASSPPTSHRSINSASYSPLHRPNTSTPLSRSSSNRLNTPSAVASQLYRAGISLDTVSHHSSISDGLYEDIDGNFIELNDKVRMLESKIEELTESQQMSIERQHRMKDEKSSLIEKIHSLEEQLREIDCRSQQQLAEEKQKYQQLLSRTDNDKSREIDFLTASLQHVEKDYNDLKLLAPQLRTENEKLKKENTRLEREHVKLVEAVDEMKEQTERLQVELRDQQQRVTQERRIHAQLVDELGKELEELRSSRLDVSIRSSGSADRRDSFTTDPLNNNKSMSVRKQLEAQVLLLKQENVRLREQCEDIHGQLVHRQLYSRDKYQQQLVTADSTTLAAEAAAAAAVAAEQLREELERLSKEELIGVVIKERDANEKLKEYVEAMTLRILERNPSILEVRTRSSF